jgi:hypothetical protein
MENYNKIEKEDWATYYYLNDELHRLDGPAIEYHYGEGKEWYQNGQLHRVSGPAIEKSNNHKEWWQNGQRHRTDGAAVELSDGDKWWFINGVQLTAAEFKLAVKNHGRTRSI